MSDAAKLQSTVGGKPADPYTAKNSDTLPTAEKINDLAEFIKKVKFGMMTTQQSEGQLLTSRCMALADTEKGGIDLFFIANLASGKISDITMHPKQVNVSFIDGSNTSWASVSGEGRILDNPADRQKYYSPSVKTWLGDLGDGLHDGGAQDPRVGIIKVEAMQATHSAAAKGAVGRGIDVVKSAVTGDVPAISSIRELSAQELNQCKYCPPSHRVSKLT